MICVEGNFPPASARVRPRMCERTFTLNTVVKVFNGSKYWRNVALSVLQGAIIWVLF